MNDLWPNLTENPFGIYIAHSWAEIGAIFRVIDEYKVRTVVELGTHRGGLSYFFIQRAKLVHNFSYYGYELHQELIDPRVMEEVKNIPRAYIQTGDIFSEAVSSRIQSIFSYEDLPILLYCDDGDKPKEIQTFAPYLNSGDIIASHDYGTEVHYQDFDCCVQFDWIHPRYLLDTRIVMMRKRSC